MRRTIAVAVGTFAITAGAVAAPALGAAKPGGRHFRMVEAGTRLSTAGSRYEDTYRIKSSPSGEGAVIRDAVLTKSSFPATGSAVVTSYFKDGRLSATETYTLAPPGVNGIGSITGNGRCTGGTFKHQGETCAYTLKGHYDLVTGITHLTLTGTYTPGKQK